MFFSHCASLHPGIEIGIGKILGSIGKMLIFWKGWKGQDLPSGDFSILRFAGYPEEEYKKEIINVYDINCGRF